MFGSNGKLNFPENHFLLTNIYSFDPEMILHSHFHFKSFSEKEREREREERAQIVEREREREEEQTSPAIALLVDRAVRRSRSSIAIVDRAARRTMAPISPLVGRSHRSRLHRAISSSPPLRDLNLTGFDEFFCWVLFLL